MNDPRIRLTIVQILSWLVSENYTAIEQFTLGVRLPATVLRQAVAQYDRAIAMPPASALDQLDVIEIDGGPEGLVCPRRLVDGQWPQ